MHLRVSLSVRSVLAEYNRNSRDDRLGLPSVRAERIRSKLFHGFDEIKGLIDGGFLQLQGPAL